MKKRRTEPELLNELKAMTVRRRGVTETAESLGFTVQFISDVLRGRRGLTEKLAGRMGYRRVVEYERVDR